MTPEEALRQLQLTLVGLQDPRESTDDEIIQALRAAGYNPKTLTARGFYQRIMEQFYKDNSDIPRKQRDVNKDCLRSSLFGHAAYRLSLITDKEARDYILTRSDTWTTVETPTRIQPIRLHEVERLLYKPIIW